MATLVVVLACAAALSGVASLVAFLVLPGRLSRQWGQLVAERVDERVEALLRNQDRLETSLRADLATQRSESAAASAQLRDELRSSLKASNDSALRQIANLTMLQKTQLERVADHIAKLTEANEKRLDALRAVLDERVRALQEDNARRLEEMRQTVDEKLQGTLEKRLGESFKLVGERLEAVQRGLGEMQTLASGVGDLKKVLQNVKTRGTWGEIQLGNLLEQMLAPEQYTTNAVTKPHSSERVEFAIRLPGATDGEEVLLPIDSKFPVEDYYRLVDASDRGDVAAVEESAKALEARIRACAQSFESKYLNPPHTTDFGILFVPTESLFAEVVRRGGLVERLQREHRVVVAGPTTLAAVLNSLQMGFRTLAIQKRSSEVWQVLGAVKAEFRKFGDAVAAVEKKLHEASEKLNAVGTRSRAIERQLKGVQELPAGDAEALLVHAAHVELIGEPEIQS